MLPAVSTAIARALEKLVQEHISDKGYGGSAFATALEALESRAGDCTEHGVLLIALARARGIPARGAFGLCYFPGRRSFGYHFWVEVWANDRWISLDATGRHLGTTAARIKLGNASLAGDAPLAAIAPVANVLGKLQIELVEEVAE